MINKLHRKLTALDNLRREDQQFNRKIQKQIDEHKAKVKERRKAIRSTGHSGPYGFGELFNISFQDSMRAMSGKPNSFLDMIPKDNNWTGDTMSSGVRSVPIEDKGEIE